MVFTLPSVLMVIEYIGSLTGMRRDSIPFRSGFWAGTDPWGRLQDGLEGKRKRFYPPTGNT